MNERLRGMAGRISPLTPELEAGGDVSCNYVQRMLYASRMSSEGGGYGIVNRYRGRGCSV